MQDKYFSDWLSNTKFASFHPYRLMNKNTKEDFLAQHTTPVMLMTDSAFFQRIIDALAKSEAALTQATEQIKTLQASVQQDRLLNESEAMEYLRRDSDTLQYYRKFGLESYKRGQYRWYKKSEIDAWLEEGKINRHRH